MTDPAILRNLIAELKSIRSPVERLRLLARAWSTVRELSPEERREIATRVGMKEVSALMERLGLKQDLVSDAVIEDVLETVRQPEEERTDEEPQLADEIEEAPVVGGPEPAAETVETPPEEEEVPSPAVVTPPEPEPDVGDLEIPPVTATIDEPPPVVVQPEPVVEAAPSEPAGEAAVEGADPLPRELLETSSLSRRFRLLRDRLRDPATAGSLPFEAVVECFPDGWARRRAVSILFGAGLPESMERALAMIDGLARRTDRRWCASALAESRRLSHDEAAALLALVPSAPLRRRLEVDIELVS